MNDRIVGCVERLAIELFSKGGDGAIVFVTNHFSGGMFAGNLPTLIIKGVAIGTTDGLTENTNMVVFVEVTELAIIGDIAPEEVVAYAIPSGAFSPKVTCCKTLDGGVTYLQFFESFVEGNDIRIWVTDWVCAWGEVAFHGLRQCHGCNSKSARCAQKSSSIKIGKAHEQRLRHKGEKKY